MSMDSVDYQNCIIVSNISDASHWLSKPDPTSVVKDYIIPNKMYELIKFKDGFDDENEIFILSEDGYYSTYYLTHKGQFIKIKEN